MIIDFHTHAFPERIAARTVDSLIARAASLGAYSITNYTDGTLRGLRELEEKAGVELAVVLPIVTAPSQTETVNRTAREINESERGIYSFGSLYPTAEDAPECVDRLAEAGFKGIKLHPEFQGFLADEVMEVYRRAALHGMTVVLHAGRDVGYPPPVKATPDMLLRIADKLPDIKLVAAHLGGWMLWEEVAQRLIGSPILFDTAFISKYIDKSLARDIIIGHGADKILFGSDCPWENPADTLKLLRSLELAPQELKKICGDNAAGLLGIEK